MTTPQSDGEPVARRVPECTTIADLLDMVDDYAAQTLGVTATIRREKLVAKLEELWEEIEAIDIGAKQVKQRAEAAEKDAQRWQFAKRVNPRILCVIAWRFLQACALPDDEANDPDKAIDAAIVKERTGEQR